MSVLIKGMEMPKNCDECKFFAWKRVVGNHCAVDESITFHATLDGLDVRYEKNGNCPLIEVPPHGRLIDADALPTYQKPIGKLMMYGGEYVYTQTAIDNAPTIIEAEEEE